jgi:type II secretory pathway component PulF
MIQDVEAGQQLSDAMMQHPKIFNKVFTSLIKAGETIGSLKAILDRIVKMEERHQALITQLRSALTYPLVLCGLSIAVVVFVLVYVLPKFMTFFEGKESILPFSTRFLILMSGSLKAHWWVYLIASTGLAVGFKLFKDSDTGTAMFDKLVLTGPVISRLSNKIYNCHLLRTLGNLMESHVPLLDALEVTRGTIGNRYYRQLIDTIMTHVREGGRFSNPFANHAYTLNSVKQMVVTGEEAGNLSAVMLRLAEFYDEEVDRELKAFASTIEPLALVVLGAIVGLIVSSVILPLFKMAHVIQ